MLLDRDPLHTHHTHDSSRTKPPSPAPRTGLSDDIIELHSGGSLGLTHDNRQTYSIAVTRFKTHSQPQETTSEGYTSRAKKDKGQKTPTYLVYLGHPVTHTHIHVTQLHQRYTTLRHSFLSLRRHKGATANPRVNNLTYTHTPTQPHCRLANDTRTLQGSETYSFRLTRHGAIHRGKGESLQRGSYKRPPFQAQVCDA